MPVDITVSENNEFINLVYTGNITNDDLLYSIKQAIELQNKNNISLYLADCSNMIAQHSILDLFTKIQSFYEIGLRKDMKEAIILPNSNSDEVSTESADKIKFYETACLNRGFKVKIFPGKDEALKWLLES